MDKEVILKTDIKREKGFLYVCSTSEDGFITVLKVKAGRKKKDEISNN